VSLDPKYKYLNGFIKSRHLDDKASGAILLYVAEMLSKLKVKLRSNIYLYFNITEETGQGIAGFPTIDDLLVVDMGVVGSGTRGDEFSVSICAKDSTGPYNYDITQTLIQLSKKHRIDYKTDIFPYLAQTAATALRAGGDMRVALNSQSQRVSRYDVPI
jgi:putative aminopeptidase FrvX